VYSVVWVRTRELVGLWRRHGSRGSPSSQSHLRRVMVCGRNGDTSSMSSEWPENGVATAELARREAALIAEI